MKGQSKEKKGWKEKLKSLNINSVVAFSAVFMSACALYISVQEVRIMRIQQKASMFPYLTVSRIYNSEGFGIRIKNSGNGLARIDSYQVFNDSIFQRLVRCSTELIA